MTDSGTPVTVTYAATSWRKPDLTPEGGVPVDITAEARALLDQPPRQRHRLDVPRVDEWEFAPVFTYADSNGCLAPTGTPPADRRYAHADTPAEAKALGW